MDVVDLVASAGFGVVEAEDADKAITIRESPSDVAAVFTDVQMSGSMDGLRLASAIRGRWPPIQIIATSGLIRISEEDLPPGSRFCRKPCSKAQIVGVLTELTG
jgi:two-component system, response regulator PdtaR